MMHTLKMLLRSSCSQSWKHRMYLPFTLLRVCAVLLVERPPQNSKLTAYSAPIDSHPSHRAIAHIETMPVRNPNITNDWPLANPGTLHSLVPNPASNTVAHHSSLPPPCVSAMHSPRVCDAGYRCPRDFAQLLTRKHGCCFVTCPSLLRAMHRQCSRRCTWRSFFVCKVSKRCIVMQGDGQCRMRSAFIGSACGEDEAREPWGCAWIDDGECGWVWCGVCGQCYLASLLLEFTKVSLNSDRSPMITVVEAWSTRKVVTTRETR
ncbi:hypothetical protein FB567DRAFT_526712 [Paraphoma chrysanthemicola]|uniref:Uncharacterized protein n=1 Tax=Paraphoma chrysanthemicola TaxID=798071 RepID=A0A8K0VYB1_9PLEO|nr:hypothetical protein FB567DRAFT_526712 [Paraphoma chrysanthemicola]